MPEPFEDFTLEQVAGSIVRLEATHDGEDLDRVEVLFRREGGPWKRYALTDASDLFVGEDTYRIEVASPPETEWVIRALDADGEPSA